MRMPVEVSETVDNFAVVSAELLAKNRFLPPRWGDIALQPRASDVASWFESFSRRNIEADKSDVIMARKSSQGARPLTFISLGDRLSYRSAVSAIESDLDVHGRSGETHESFLKDPLGVEGCRYILKTDIAAFYQYVDHERLIDEVVAQTGDDIAISFAVDILQGVSGRRFGLPQMTGPSDVLADAYIRPMHRALAREGFIAFRFADDFRIACKKYSEALSAREVAERAALDLGLVLSESKTTVPSRRTYERQLGDVDRAEQEAFSHVEAEGQLFGGDSEYGDGDVADEMPSSFGVGVAGTADDEVDFGEDESESPEPVHEAQVSAAQAVILAAVDPEEAEIGDDWSTTTISVLLRKALRTLTLAQDPSALKYATDIVVSEPHLTPQLCAYIISVSQTHRRAAIRTLERICARDVASVWQSLWLSYCIGEVPRETSERQGQIAWLRERMRSQQPALSVEATLALARLKTVDPREVGQMLTRLPAVHRPTAVIALAALDANVSEVVGENQIERWQAAWAAEHLA